jgi:hypothetical protein
LLGVVRGISSLKRYLEMSEINEVASWGRNASMVLPIFTRAGIGSQKNKVNPWVRK